MGQKGAAFDHWTVHTLRNAISMRNRRCKCAIQAAIAHLVDFSYRDLRYETLIGLVYMKFEHSFISKQLKHDSNAIKGIEGHSTNMTGEIQLHIDSSNSAKYTSHCLSQSPVRWQMRSGFSPDDSKNDQLKLLAQHYAHRNSSTHDKSELFLLRLTRSYLLG